MSDEDQVVDETQDESPDFAKPRVQRGKKVSKMNLGEVEAALSKLKETMGGHHSAFARSLLAHKEFLLRYQSSDEDQALPRAA